jgi:hypothetical protein
LTVGGEEKAKRRGIPHFADFVRNDASEVFREEKSKRGVHTEFAEGRHRGRREEKRTQEKG